MSKPKVKAWSVAGEKMLAQGRPQEQGIGSTLWLLRVSEEEAEGCYSAIARWRGPAAAQAERERIARLKGKKLLK